MYHVWDVFKLILLARGLQSALLGVHIIVVTAAQNTYVLSCSKLGKISCLLGNDDNCYVCLN